MRKNTPKSWTNKSLRNIALQLGIGRRSREMRRIKDYASNFPGGIDVLRCLSESLDRFGAYYTPARRRAVVRNVMQFGCRSAEDLAIKVELAFDPLILPEEGKLTLASEKPSDRLYHDGIKHRYL